jgi:hypothetical protein
MTFPVTKIKTRDSFGVTYSAPTDPELTVRFKTAVSSKSIGGISLQNYLSEIIMNDLHTVTVGSSTANDPISVRLRISGALESRTRVAEMLTELASRIATWESEDVFIGFEPTTAPGSV